MKIIDAPQYGPMFRFSDSNVYWALHLLSGGKRIGRKKLAESLGIGEGSMRRIIDTLRDWEMISVKQTGISITKSGIGFLNDIPVKVIDIDLGDSAVGKYQQGVIVYDAADKIFNGMQQRDAGIKAGAEGCTTIVMRDGVLTIPPDWNVDSERPDLAKRIRRDLRITERDVIIVGSSNSPHTAVNAVLTAAFELF
jgi:uncharacterized protein (UPF0548 family)